MSSPCAIDGERRAEQDSKEGGGRESVLTSEAIANEASKQQTGKRAKGSQNDVLSITSV
jgi:hypothetical protein